MKANKILVPIDVSPSSDEAVVRRAKCPVFVVKDVPKAT